MTKTAISAARYCAWAFIVLGLWLGYPNKLVSLPFAALLYPLGLAMVGRFASSARQAFVEGWLVALTGHVLALYWLYVPIITVGGLPLAAAVPCAIVVCLVLATQCGVFALAARAFWRPDQALSSLAMALVWYFLEWAWALTAGFPWLPISGALAPLAWSMQAADTLGATLTGSLWAGCVLALGGAVLSGFVEGRTRSFATGFVTALVLAGALGGYGIWRTWERVPAVGPQAAPMVLPSPNPAPGTFPVLLVEGNIDQNQKWVEAFRTATVKTYTELTLQAVEKARSRAERAGGEQAVQAMDAWLTKGLILWPETAMPFDLARSNHTRQIMAMVVAAHMPLLTGAPAQEAGPGRSLQIFNRVWLLDANGYPAGSYDKEHLVPFGEYVPSFFRWKFLEGLLQEVGAYSVGTRTEPLRTGSLSLGPLICYEAVFPWLAQERVAKGATVLADVSNDAWFGDTSAPWQHLALTGLRAIEQNRYLVRCTNSGISAIFDNRGRCVFQGPQFSAGALWAEAAAISAPSLFHLWFRHIPLICACVLAALLLIGRLRNRTR